MANNKNNKKFQKGKNPKYGKDQRKPKSSSLSNTGENDLKWYNNYPNLAGGMVGANFARRKGIADNITTSTKFAIPSIAGLNTILTIGKTSGDAYHTAINKLWASLRSANTGSVQYTKLDLECYLLNLRLILAETRYLRRAYGVLKKFDLFDKTTPVSIFKAMGLDYDSFNANAANLRNILNYSSVKVHTLMPAKLDVLERTCWMFDNIFKDGNDAKSQLYLFSLDNANNFMYDWANSAVVRLTSTSSITTFANTATTTGQSYAVAITNYQAHIAMALASDKVQIIAADILKAYGPGQIAYFDEIPENYSINYVYSEEVLTQIQNAVMLGGSRSTTPTQDSGHNISISGSTLEAEAHLATPPVTDDGSTINISRAFINMYKDNISNLDLIGATRLCWTAVADATITGRFNLQSFGTEIIQSFDIVTTMKPYGDTSTYLYDLYLRQYATLNVLNTLIVAGVVEIGLMASLWATFDWAPKLFMSRLNFYDNTGTATQSGYGSYPIWDFNNFALVEESQVDTYHDIAILSTMYVDSMVKNINLLAIK